MPKRAVTMDRSTQAIDWATRWVFLRVYAGQDEDGSVDFLNQLDKAAPMKIDKVLTDNGSQFTGRLTSKKREPSGKHKFDVRCKALGIEHRLCPPRHPQTNGMVERLNGRVSEVVKQTRFTSAAQLEQTLTAHLKTYNQCIPQRALGHQTPLQALKQWQTKQPALFGEKGMNRRVWTAIHDHREVRRGRGRLHPLVQRWADQDLTRISQLR